jgi:hypothetical protein
VPRFIARTDHEGDPGAQIRESHAAEQHCVRVRAADRVRSLHALDDVRRRDRQRVGVSGVDAGAFRDRQRTALHAAAATRTPAAATAAGSGTGAAATALGAARVDTVKHVADAGEVMPQKSTYFFPKIASGVVMNRIDPDEDLL